MTKIKDKIVLITGGASGIGKLLGEKCLAEGAKNLIIWDINEINLKATIQEFAEKGFSNVKSYLVDVADTQDIEQTAQKVLAEFGGVDILFNNAGIVVGKEFKNHTANDIDKSLQINVLGVMHITRMFLPKMLETKQGHIINIGSASSLTPNPKMSVYAASKWAILGWSESLRLELERESPDLQVTTVLPSYINTGMFAGVKSPLLTPILEPEDISNQIITAIKYNQIQLLSPFTVNLIPVLRGILPTRIFDFVAGSIFGVYDTMADFMGRTKNETIPTGKKNIKEKELV